MRWLGREPHSFGTQQSEVGKSCRWGSICHPALKFTGLEVVVFQS